MAPRVEEAVVNVQLQQFVNSTTRLKNSSRMDTCREAFGDDYDAVRHLAGRIKQHTLDHLDVYLQQFVEQAQAAGTQVHVARDAAEANQICLQIMSQHGCRTCVKSKSMVTEEIGLNQALEGAGVETVETDLGEFIIQLDHDAPSHIVSPMIHKDRATAGRAIERELGVEYTDDPATLTKIARNHMRRAYRQADVGLSGANFLIAETGSLVVCTNEGNADLSMSSPPLHIALVGIEKLIPRPEDLSVFLKLLSRSATGQNLTVYNTIVTGPRRHDDPDGPESQHIILVDNGRTELLRAESRELLRCIRCGACLNACPVYRKVGGGHAYGAVYSGPIGAVLMPALKGVDNYPDLPQASSLCGACFEACPVEINIPYHLVRLRRELNKQRITPWRSRLAYRLWGLSMRWAPLYRLTTRLQSHWLRRRGKATRGVDPFDDAGWAQKLPGPLAGWTDYRDMPTPMSERFRDWWKAR
jgi:L-lactate dehydrogenase complex protein LldF